MTPGTLLEKWRRAARARVSLCVAEKSATTRGVFNSKAWGYSNQEPAGPSALLEMGSAKRRAVGGAVS